MTMQPMPATPANGGGGGKPQGGGKPGAQPKPAMLPSGGPPTGVTPPALTGIDARPSGIGGKRTLERVLPGGMPPQGGKPGGPPKPTLGPPQGGKPGGPKPPQGGKPSGPPNPAAVGGVPPSVKPQGS